MLKYTLYVCQIQQKWLNDLITHLHEPVHGDPPDEGVGEELGDGEDGEDDPVHQPLRVVRLGARLQGLDRPAREGGETAFQSSCI